MAIQRAVQRFAQYKGWWSRHCSIPGKTAGRSKLLASQRTGTLCRYAGWEDKNRSRATKEPKETTAGGCLPRGAWGVPSQGDQHPRLWAATMHRLGSLLERTRSKSLRSSFKNAATEFKVMLTYFAFAKLSVTRMSVNLCRGDAGVTSQGDGGVTSQGAGGVLS